MFEHCMTLAELNGARIKAVSGGTDIVTVNNSYNKRRNEILNARKSYRVLQFLETPKGDSGTISYLNIVGRSDIPGVIKCTAQGIYI